MVLIKPLRIIPLRIIPPRIIPSRMDVVQLLTYVIVRVLFISKDTLCLCAIVKGSGLNSELLLKLHDFSLPR